MGVLPNRQQRRRMDKELGRDDRIDRARSAQYIIRMAKVQIAMTTHLHDVLKKEQKPWRMKASWLLERIVILPLRLVLRKPRAWMKRAFGGMKDPIGVPLLLLVYLPAILLLTPIDWLTLTPLMKLSTRLLMGGFSTHQQHMNPFHIQHTISRKVKGKWVPMEPTQWEV